jgi:hypothetical protein
MIRYFNAFITWKKTLGSPVHGDFQNLATKVDFQEFRLSRRVEFQALWYPAGVPTLGPTPGFPTVAPPVSVPHVRDQVADFKRGIRRDASAFIILKDNKQWDNCHRTLRAQSSTQDVDDVLDPNYVPISIEDIALFAEKQKFMYSVLERILQTDEGKVIVRSHDKDRDAQLIYNEFLHTMTKSTEAAMDSGALLSYLTSTKITDGWKGTSKAFVLSWVDKLRMYHDLVPTRMPDDLQLSLLQNAVIGLNALQQVQLNADLQKTMHGTVLTFAQYFSLLLNTATGYDQRRDKPNTTGRSRRALFNSEMYFPYDDGQHDDDADEGDDFNVDTTTTQLQAYAMERHARNKFKPGSRMPYVRWNSISEVSQRIWDTMADEDKACILALSEKTPKIPRGAPPRISANSHETQDVPPDVPPDDLDDTLIAMVTKHSNRQIPPSHAGDVRSVLSQASKAAKADKVHVQDTEVSINGAIYVRKGTEGTSRKVNSHDIRYCVSQASRNKTGSLIDRGANGGIAGTDT